MKSTTTRSKNDMKQKQGRWAFLRRIGNNKNKNKQEKTLTTNTTTDDETITTKTTKPIRNSNYKNSNKFRTLDEELADLQILDEFQIDDIISDDTSEVPVECDHLQHNHPGPGATLHVLLKTLEEELKMNIDNEKGKKSNLSNFYIQETVNKFKVALHEDYYTCLQVDNEQQEQDEHIQHRFEAKTCVMHGFFAHRDMITRLQKYFPENIEGYPTSIELVFGIVEKFLLEHVLSFTTETNDSNIITPKKAAQTITWIEQTLEEIENKIPDIEISTVWYKWAEQMWSIYAKKAVHRKMDKVFTKSIDLTTDNDVRINNNGNAVSGQPEGIMYAINGQIEVAKEYLPSKYVERVAVLCNKGISQFVADQMLLVTATWKQTSTIRFCAFINDAFIFSDLIDEFNNIYMPNNTELSATVIRDLSELSILATNYLCERIISDLREPVPILSSIGNPTWENNDNKNDNGAVIKRTINTYKDFFTDLEVWLCSMYYFPKMLKKLFDLTIEEYIHSFFSNTMTFGVQCPICVSEKLSQDYSRLVEFYSSDSYQKYAGKGGLYTTADMIARLHIIQSISTLMDPKISPVYLKEDISIILHHSDQSSAAVLHIAGLRQLNHGTDDKPVDWFRVIAHAEKDCCDGVTSSTFTFKLPDLRNSKYIRNVQVSDKEISARVSLASQEKAKNLQNITETNSESKILVGVITGHTKRKVQEFVSGVTSRVLQPQSPVKKY